MIKTLGFLGLSTTLILLVGCQSTAQQFNGQSGYQIIEQGNDTATLSYALSGNTQKDQPKLQNACQQVLGPNKTYNVKVISSSEIANNTTLPQFGRQIGNTNTKFGLSNTPDLYNNDIPGTAAALNTKPTTLRLIHFNCS